MKTAELWKPVVGFEGRYDVSNRGDVRSWYRGGKKLPAPRIRRLVVNHHGYVQITLLRADGRLSTRTVHSLVLEAFKGARPAGRVACHGDGNRANNALQNLAWVTQKENIGHKAVHGTQPRGETHVQAKGII